MLRLDGIVSGNISVISSISGTVSIGTSDVPIYSGNYEIAPLPETDTIMETAGKRMMDDVVVLAIPYSETTNESGGYTVNIG